MPFRQGWCFDRACISRPRPRDNGGPHGHLASVGDNVGRRGQMPDPRRECLPCDLSHLSGSSISCQPRDLQDMEGVRRFSSQNGPKKPKRQLVESTAGKKQFPSLLVESTSHNGVMAGPPWSLSPVQLAELHAGREVAKSASSTVAPVEQPDSVTLLARTTHRCPSC